MRIVVTEKQLSKIVNDKTILEGPQTQEKTPEWIEKFMGAAKYKLSKKPKTYQEIFDFQTYAKSKGFKNIAGPRKGKLISTDGKWGKNTQAAWNEFHGAAERIGTSDDDTKISKEDYKGIQIMDDANPKFTQKLNPKKLSTTSSVAIFGAGQQECAQFVNDFADNIDNVGNAWLAHNNRSLGSLVYTAFENLSPSTTQKIINLWKKIDSKGGGEKNGPYKSEVKSLVSQLVGSFGTPKLKLGDVVGIFYPPSSWHEYAFYESGKPYFVDQNGSGLKKTNRKVSCSTTENPELCSYDVLVTQASINDNCDDINIKLKEDGQTGKNTKAALALCKTSTKKAGNTISGGDAWGMNTHVGIVGAVKDGVPLIFHNIHGQVYSDPANRLEGGGKIAWVRRPSGVLAKYFWKVFG
jgi:hypothetical protein